MARKKKQTKQKQKQQQKQTVKVVVNVGEKKKRKSSKRRPKRAQAEEVVQYKAFPPQIIYQQAPLTFYPSEQPAARSIMDAPEVPKGLMATVAPSLEDVGQVGTEGPVEILDLPTKRETLSELIEPVSEMKPPIQTYKLQEPLMSQIGKPAASLVEGLEVRPMSPQVSFENIYPESEPKEEVVAAPQKKQRAKPKTLDELREQYLQLMNTKADPSWNAQKLRGFIKIELDTRKAEAKIKKGVEKLAEKLKKSKRGNKAAV